VILFQAQKQIATQIAIKIDVYRMLTTDQKYFSNLEKEGLIHKIGRPKKPVTAKINTKISSLELKSCSNWPGFCWPGFWPPSFLAESFGVDMSWRICSCKI